jgi:hypothetical protein
MKAVLAAQLDHLSLQFLYANRTGLPAVCTTGESGDLGFSQLLGVLEVESQAEGSEIGI